MTDYRALCEELTIELDRLRAWYIEDNDCYSLDLEALLHRARAALAEQPVGPTRGEAVAVYTEVMAAHDCQTLGDMAEHFARAVLARWGQS
jgi:hypothetical protein